MGDESRWLGGSLFHEPEPKRVQEQPQIFVEYLSAWMAAL